LKRLCVLKLLALCFCLSPSAFAQSTNATLSGLVVDTSSRAIPDAEIEILNEATGVSYPSRTNTDGIYTVTILPAGQYRVQVSKQGFKTAIKPGIVLDVQSAVVLNFTLPIGATSETVTVSGGSSNIDTSDASVSTVIDHQFVDNMPMNGRSLQTLISLVPGVVQTPIPYGSSSGNSGEFSVNGQRTEANYYTVDGVSGTVGTGSNGSFTAGASGLLPAQTALGTTQSLASVDDLEEFRINTSTYSAEYGRTPGGQIALETRSGTDHLHGTVFDYFRNDALDANNWFNDNTSPITPKTEERQNDFGGTLGGPVDVPHLYDGRRHTFFFYSYEGLRLRIPTPSTTTEVPDASLRELAAPALLPFLDAFPDANQGEVDGAPGLAYFTAAYSLPAGLDSNSVRLDHTAGTRLHMFGRYSDTSSSSIARSSADLAQLSPVSFVTRSTTAGLTTTFRTNLVNDLRFNYTWYVLNEKDTIDSLGGATPSSIGTFLPQAPYYAQFAAFLFFGTNPAIDMTTQQIGQTQINLVDSQGIDIGRHSLKMGVDFRRLQLTEKSNQFLGAPLYFAESSVESNMADFATASTSGLVPDEPIFENFSAFMQDDWKLNPRVTLSLGLRWDLNPPPGNGNGRIPPVLDQISNLATAQLAPEGTPEWNTDYLGFAPRLGIATVLRTNNGWESVLRTGIGEFFDTGTTLGAVGFTQLGFGSIQFYYGLSFPFASSFYDLPAASTATPFNETVMAYQRDLKLPYTLDWNLSFEQGLGTSRSLTLGYVASVGRRLVNGLFENPSSPAFSQGNGVFLIDNGSWSDYQSLQAQFRQRLAHGIQLLASTTWSHSIDDRSTNFISYQPLLKGDSDFDVRENFQVAATYDFPILKRSRATDVLANGWALDLRAFSRTAPPVDIYGSSYVASNGTEQYARPNLVAGEPFYVYGPHSQIPGGRKINFDAFQDVTGSLGDAPRNFLRAFGADQTDLALRRQFQVADQVKIQFRAEAFNVLNHPDFGSIYNTLNTGAALFGQAYNTLNIALKNQNPLYEQGGPRSLQLALKILF
jgi:Carboxypeptidase regulatory-like domain